MQVPDLVYSQVTKAEMKQSSNIFLSLSILVAGILISYGLLQVAKSLPNSLNIRHEGHLSYNEPLLVRQLNSSDGEQNRAIIKREIKIDEEELVIWPKKGVASIQFDGGCTMMFDNGVLQVTVGNYQYYYYEPYKWEVKFIPPKYALVK